MKNSPIISVTFDLGCLAELAMKQASTMPMFKDVELFSRAEFETHHEEYFVGITISTKPDEAHL
jgi:hypothetical protein